MSRKALEELTITHALGAFVIHDDNVQAAECGLMPAKRLAYYPFQAISCYSQAAIFFGDRHSEPGIAVRGPAKQDGEVSIATAVRVREDLAKRRFIRQPLVAAKGEPSCWRRVVFGFARDAVRLSLENGAVTA
ncbi:MAG: hypothetical protein WBN23_04805 [Woeseia sp.]